MAKETRTEEKRRFIANLLICYPNIDIAKLTRIANVLYRTATTLHRSYEVDCSVELSPYRQTVHDTEQNRLEALVKAYCDMIKLPFTLNGDPRGAPIQVRLPNGRGNGWEPGVWYI